MGIISRVIPPRHNGDMDYIGFSFNGVYSINDDFEIYRIIDGDRFTTNLGPRQQDKTAENTGGDGTYFFGSSAKSKQFSINFAFDNLTDIGLRKLKEWLGYKEIADLWFYEEPYKVYSVKISGQPNIRFIPFNNGTERVYKGEGSVQFIAYWPYAHTPHFVGENEIELSGKKLESYTEFYNYNTWFAAGGLLPEDSDTCQGENPGELPTHFVLTKSGKVDKNTTFTVGDITITILAECYDLEWDSKTGIVSASVEQDGERTPQPYSGNPCGTIPVGGTNKIDLKNGTLEYHYWYY